MTEKERNLLYGVVSLILPENILDQFDIVKLEDEDINRHDGTYQPFKHNVHTYLAGVISVYETLLSELDEVYTVIGT